MGYIPAHEVCQTCDDKGVLPVDDPCSGHATEEEACEHYRRYILDTSVTFHSWDNQKKKCLVCGEWTQKFALVDTYTEYDLCPDHCNLEEVEKLYPKVGTSIHS